MGQIIVVAFDDPNEAQQVAATFKDIEKGGGVKLQDMRVVVKDAEGKIHLQDEAGHPVAWGAVIGGALGGLLFILMPVIGIAAGAAVGGFIAKSMDLDVDKKFIQDVSDALKPNTSAIFILAGEGNAAAVLNAFKPYKGTLLQTSLSSEAEEQLKQNLSKSE